MDFILDCDNIVSMYSHYLDILTRSLQITLQGEPPDKLWNDLLDVSEKCMDYDVRW